MGDLIAREQSRSPTWLIVRGRAKGHIWQINYFSTQQVVQQLQRHRPMSGSAYSCVDWVLEVSGLVQTLSAATPQA
jgi:hypothetical protein